jgi:hypothetical protein
MADFIDLGTISNDVTFRQRCLYAAYVQAVFTMNTASSVPPSMISLCTSITNNSVSGTGLALIVLANPTVAAEATVASLPGCTAVSDTDIQTAIAEAFNAMAGIPAN